MKRLFLYEWLLSRTPGEYTKVRSFGYHVFHAWAVKRTRPGALLTICVGEEPQFCYNEQWHRGARGTATLHLRWDEHDYHHEGVWEAFWFDSDPSRRLRWRCSEDTA